MLSHYSPDIEALMQMHFASLSEKDKRHYAAVECIKLGWGGLAYISNLLSINHKTIIKGKNEVKSLLLDKTLAISGQRKSGGGRKKSLI